MEIVKCKTCGKPAKLVKSWKLKGRGKETEISLYHCPDNHTTRTGKVL